MTKPVTIWKMRYKRKDEPETWEHSHIEDGHSHRDEPHAKSAWQVEKWNNQKWQRTHGYLNDNVVNTTRAERLMMKKKYLLQGGYITSKHDKQRHYISANQLATLYKVNMAECFAIDEQDPPQKAYGLPKDLIVLRPDYDGNYTLPKD